MLFVLDIEAESNFEALTHVISNHTIQFKNKAYTIVSCEEPEKAENKETKIVIERVAPQLTEGELLSIWNYSNKGHIRSVSREYQIRVLRLAETMADEINKLEKKGYILSWKSALDLCKNSPEMTPFRGAVMTSDKLCGIFSRALGWNLYNLNESAYEIIKKKNGVKV